MNAPLPGHAMVPDALIAKAARQRRQHPPMEALAEMTGLAAPDLVTALAARIGWHCPTANEFERLKPAFDRLDLADAMARGCVLFRAGERLLAIVADPFDFALQRWIEARAGGFVTWGLATQADLQTWLARQEQKAHALENVATDTGNDADNDDGSTEDLSLARIRSETSTVIRLVNSTLHDALKAGASDIHLESTAAGLEIKYRIDGVLEQIRQVAGREVCEQAISRLKVMAQLDIAERRVPQDGRLRVRIGSRAADVRVSIMPCIHGEDAVLRILDKRALLPESGKLTLDLLGFEEASLSAVRRLAAQPYGMLLVTGPTGSGKTTTLYAALSEIHNGREKIVTIEDPVEYELPGILQIPVNEKKGLTFARGLRSILRHDPDKIMVGEIRDGETAEIAVQSALTGHLVLSTVHANSVFDVMSRFTHMGIDAYALTAALNGIWAQRLVRLVCPSCAHDVTPDPQTLARAGLSEEDVAGWHLRQGRGCPECRGSGYRGRRAIAEVLLLTDRIREMITDRAPLHALREEARRGGTRSLREAALKLAREGITTLEEVSRVTLQS
jgi:general secretion pathway protein E